MPERLSMRRRVDADCVTANSLDSFGEAGPGLKRGSNDGDQELPARGQARDRWRVSRPCRLLARRVHLDRGTGEHALARLSDLSPPTAPPVYAVTAGQMREFLSGGWAELREAEYDSDGTLAIWRYDPRVLARNLVVDPLSLVAQFWEDPDERLSMAVDRLLEQWTW